MMAKVKTSLQYRLALDLGTTSIGWALLQLKPVQATDGQLPIDYKLKPTAIIKAGVRIFNSGRDPKTEASLAVTRREARLMRRRRDRLLKRKARMMDKLVQHGFFPKDEAERKQLETLNPYELRAKGVQEALSAGEFARALFHINQRRGFKSNRKTDKGQSDSGALKTAIRNIQSAIASYPLGSNGKPQSSDVPNQKGQISPDHFKLIQWVNRELPETKNDMPRTVGELLWNRMQKSLSVRAKNNGLSGAKLSYDLYIDRAMVEQEFDAIWAKQAELNPQLFSEAVRADLKDTLLFQRNLRPVKPGRCTLESDEPRAPLALPSSQRFRIYQEVNHLRLLGQNLEALPLTLEQRDTLAQELERKAKLSFTGMKKLLGLSGSAKFNLEDDKREDLKGNATAAALAKKELLGQQWFSLSPEKQDEIVEQLCNEESQGKLLDYLQQALNIDEAKAEALANTSLAPGYGSLSHKALAKILPALQAGVITYDKAVQAAGYSHHSNLGFDYDTDEIETIVDLSTGEITAVMVEDGHGKKHPIFKQLPYYGKPLRRFVAFEKENPKNDEERYGKIANPTVHIGLNQIRVVVNAIICKYGRPTEVVIELARDLKQSREQKQEEQKRQAANQKRNARIRAEAAAILGCAPERVSRADIQKWILWEELSFDAADRKCPYSGVQISASMLLLSGEVEIEHILPFSQTLDNSLNNRTVAMRQANRIKGDRTPWDAREDFARQGWAWDDIQARASRMPKGKRYRFAADGYQQWLKKDGDFLARALNDTRYLSRIAKEYLQLVCPGSGVRVIPGQLTAMLRDKFGLNQLLSGTEAKNRNDHRHHALDACVIGITDQGMLQRFANASKATRTKERFDKLVENMPQPWPTYRQHVERAIDHIWVSHKPDHGFEGAMMEATAYGIGKDGQIKQKTKADGSPAREVKNLIRISEATQPQRHGLDTQGQPLPYIGYIGGSNYCIEITRGEAGKWEGSVISTFEAYQIVRQHGLKQLRHPQLGQNGQALVMRLVIGDAVRMKVGDSIETMRFVKVAASNGQMTFAPVNEANVDARNNDKDDGFAYTTKYAGSLQTAKGRWVGISAIGELRDPGFQG